MTRKLAGLTGFASTCSLSLILVFSILLPSFGISMPKTHFEFSKEEEVLPTQVVAIEPVSVVSEEDILQRLDEKPNPHQISRQNKASVSAALYGAAPENDRNRIANSSTSTLSSLVLASRVDARELGVYSAGYSITPEEYEMLLYCIDHETRSGSLEHRTLICQVVLNRVMSPRFANTVSEVLMAPNQFDVMPGFASRGDWTPKETTRQAVDMTLSGLSPDYAQGALYFCNPYLVGEGNWFDQSLTVICEIEGHRFYK